MDERRKKLKFRAWRRGFREMDLLMGTFADAHIANLSEADLDEFERLLATPDWDVFAWLVGQKPIPDNYRSDLLDRLLTFRYEAQAG
ncbi:MAG: succinate dehydrogenase assembly factor 2 [Alphaproteobacteria bacterium]|nr:succinate dehydrogenase assembly factor 2 [Alphaproteobacteria bacterium]